MGDVRGILIVKQLVNKSKKTRTFIRSILSGVQLGHEDFAKSLRDVFMQPGLRAMALDVTVSLQDITSTEEHDKSLHENEMIRIGNVRYSIVLFLKCSPQMNS